MSEYGTEVGKKNRNWLAIGAGTLAALFVCVCVGVAGFALGSFVVGRDSAANSEPGQAVEGVVVYEETAVSPENTEPAITNDDTEPAESAEDATGQAGDNVSSAPTLEPGTETAVPQAQEQPTEPYTDIEKADLELLYEVWNLVEDRFDGTLPPEEALINALVSGSLDTLDDPYTRYITPDVAARMREDMGGSVSGIGAFVQENEDGLVEIVTPIKDQPADLAGLQPGDIVIGVDGQNVIGMSFDEVLLMVRGPEGTDVTLEIVRADEEEPIFFTITRTRFEVPVVEAEMLPDNIAYISLLEFNQVAAERMMAELSVLLAQNPNGLILDLRNNPGGFLNQSIEIADFFLPESVVLLERNNQGLDETFTAETGDFAEKIPMVVLINQGSASASEIVAGALRDNGRATLIGETSFGKGSVQQVYTLSNGGELRVTIARWYTPDNISISDNGITPDIEVEMPLDVEFGSDEDVQLQRAIEYLQNGQ